MGVYLIGFSQLGKLLFGLRVVWIGVWVVTLRHLDRLVRTRLSSKC